MAAASGEQTLAVGRQHHQAGRLDQAEAIYRAVLEQSPGEAEALHLMGLLAFHRNRLAEALDWLERAVAAAPQTAKYHGNLGTVRVATGRHDAALPALERALELDPQSAEFNNSLGEARRMEGNPKDAIASFRRAIDIDPGYGQAHGNLAVALTEAGEPAAALASAEAAVAAEPDDGACHNTLGTVLMSQGSLDQAMAAFRRAIEIDPGLTEARRNLGLLLMDGRQYDEAGTQYRAAMEARPAEASGYAGLARVLRLQGRIEDSIALYRTAVEMAPGIAVYHSNLLFALLGAPSVDAASLYDETRAWNARHGAPLTAAAPPHDKGRDPERRLRIGYVSPNFRNHPVGHLALPVVAGHRAEDFQVFCYSDVRDSDAITERFRAAVPDWRDVTGLDNGRLAEQVRSDGIDILVDLAGHTARNRLLALARKPAPIQMSWLGYMSTSGLDAMDYLIGDPVHTPAGCEAAFSETILRLDHDLVCFVVPDHMLPVARLPMATAGHVTFGSFNNPAKISGQAAALWARVLLAVPGSRLILKYRGLDDPGTAAALLERFAGHGIEPERLELLGGSTYTEVLAAYHRVDVALDTCPYSGTMTTLEALTMGVPVLTCPGESMVSRTSAAHMAAAGLDDLVAATPDGLVELAVSLAGDPARLVALRAGMRDRLAASKLSDVPGFVSGLEALYRDAWRRWCASVL